MTAHPLHATPGSAHGVALLAVPAVAELAAPDSYMARNSRSFHFAAAFMRRAERERTARVYAWCRFVDDLADATGDPALAEAQLDTWLECSRAAYDGRPSGMPLIDQVMAEMAERGVPQAACPAVAQAPCDPSFKSVADGETMSAARTGAPHGQ